MKLTKSFTVMILSILMAMGWSEGESVTVLKNVNLVPMTGEIIIENQSVLVKGDRILKIAPADKLRKSQTATVIDGKGAYLMPGLADMHVHLKGNWPISQLDLYLANGVTTVRDLDGRDFMLKWREEIKAGKRTGSTIYVSSQTLRGYEKNAPQLVEIYKSGYDCIKFYSYFSNNDFQEAMARAKKHKLYTVGHIPFAVGLDGVISAGMDEIAHVEELSFELVDFDRTRDLDPEAWLPYIIGNAFKQYPISFGFHVKALNNDQKERLSAITNKLKSKNIPVCTTLVVDDVIVQKLFEPDKFLARRDSVFLPRAYKQAFLQGKEKHQQQFKGIEDLAPFKYGLDKTLSIELHRAGIPLILGTDAGSGAMGIVPGFSIHDELHILVENGLTPYEAIATGTVNAAAVVEAMTGQNEFGTIEVGKRADFILVNRNPLEAVSHIRDNRGVMAAGKWYERSYLQAIISPSLVPGIPFEANVYQVRRPDSGLNTEIEILFGENFYGKLPDDIDSITATLTGPDGIPSQLVLPRYRYLKDLKDFWYRIDGPPALGKYTFRVTSRGSSGTATDFQTINRELPLPDITSFAPAEGETLTSKTPVFSWAPVEYPAAEIYYRLVIDDLTGKRIYGSGRKQNMLAHTVPEGTLQPGQTYRYRVRVMDSEDWVEIQNRSESQAVTFTMSEVLE